jgi:hypothetical protein
MRRDQGAIAALAAAAALAGIAVVSRRESPARGNSRGSRSYLKVGQSSHPGGRFLSPGVERFGWVDAEGAPLPEVSLVLYEPVGGLGGSSGRGNAGLFWDDAPVHERAKRVERHKREVERRLRDEFDELVHGILVHPSISEALDLHPEAMHDGQSDPLVDKKGQPLQISGHVFSVAGWVPLGLNTAIDRFRTDVAYPNQEPAVAERRGDHTMVLGVQGIPDLEAAGDLTPKMVLDEEVSPYIDAAEAWVTDEDDGGDLAALILRYRYTFDAVRPTERDLERLAHDVPQGFFRKRLLGGRSTYRYWILPDHTITVPTSLAETIRRRRRELGLEG